MSVLKAKEDGVDNFIAENLFKIIGAHAGEYDDNGKWFADLKNVEERIGFDGLITKIISALVYSNADVDDIKIFTRAISSDEVLDNYQDENVYETDILTFTKRLVF